MSDEPQDSPQEIGDNAGKVLERAIEEIERLEEEKKAIGEDIKAVYASAAGDGIDKEVLKQIIKERKADTEKTVEKRTTAELYRRALSKLQGSLGDWARQFRSRTAKYKLDQVAEEGADAQLAEFMKNRKAANDAKGKGDSEAQP